VIGYIIPGLIANTALSQGYWATVGTTLVIAILVRLLLAVAGGLVA
jgi:uncharacterized membrane protein